MNLAIEYIFFFENQGFVPSFFGVVIVNETLYPGAISPSSTVAAADFSRDGINAPPINDTVTYKGSLVDFQNAPVTQILSLNLTLAVTNVYPPQIVNNVDHVNVFNQGRGTVDASGNAVITLSADDTALLVPGDLVEYRTMLLEWTYNSPAGVAQGRRRVLLKLLAFEENP